MTGWLPKRRKQDADASIQVVPMLLQPPLPKGPARREQAMLSTAPAAAIASEWIQRRRQEGSIGGAAAACVQQTDAQQPAEGTRASPNPPHSVDVEEKRRVAGVRVRGPAHVVKWGSSSSSGSDSGSDSDRGSEGRRVSPDNRAAGDGAGAGLEPGCQRPRQPHQGNHATQAVAEAGLGGGATERAFAPQSPGSLQPLSGVQLWGHTTGGLAEAGRVDGAGCSPGGSTGGGTIRGTCRLALLPSGQVSGHVIDETRRMACGLMGARVGAWRARMGTAGMGLTEGAAACARHYVLEIICCPT